MCMKAIFEAEFEPDMMIDSEALQSEYGGDLNKVMQYLYEQEGTGIFNEIKFIRCE